MAIRAGMVEVVAELRRMTDTKENEVDINGVMYWTDDQLQSILDKRRKYVQDALLLPVPEVVNSVTTWTRYHMPEVAGVWERSTMFQVVTSTGVAAPTHTIEYDAGIVTFAVTTDGQSYYIRGRLYDLNKAAAQVWLDKAAHRAELIRWKAGTHTLDEDQEYQHCLEMYRKYASYSGIGVVRMTKRGYAHGQNYSI